MLGSGTAHQVRPAGFSVVDAVVLEQGRPLKVKIGPIKVRCQSATGPSRGVERPYLSVDTTYVTARGTERILSVAAIVAVGVNSDGHRDVLGLQVRRRSEAEPFSTEFLRSLNRSGLHAFKFVICDRHERVMMPGSNVFQSICQRRGGHYMRNALVHAGLTRRRVVSAVIGTVIQESADGPRQPLVPRQQRVASRRARTAADRHHDS